MEYRLSIIYHDIVSPGALSIPTMVSYSDGGNSFVRSEMLRKAVEAHVFKAGFEDTRDGILALLKLVNALAVRRNEIAHGVAGRVKLEGKDMNYLLRPAFYNFKKFDKTALYRATFLYGSDALTFYFRQFEALGKTAEGLMESIKRMNA